MREDAIKKAFLARIQCYGHCEGCGRKDLHGPFGARASLFGLMSVELCRECLGVWAIDSLGFEELVETDRVEIERSRYVQCGVGQIEDLGRRLAETRRRLLGRCVRWLAERIDSFAARKRADEVRFDSASIRARALFAEAEKDGCHPPTETEVMEAIEAAETAAWLEAAAMADQAAEQARYYDTEGAIALADFAEKIRSARKGD